jgi:hypothetical protein
MEGLLSYLLHNSPFASVEQSAGATHLCGSTMMKFNVCCRTALLDSESELDRQLAPVALTPEDNRLVGSLTAFYFWT